MKNIFQKTALALTIATMSAGAFAGTLTGNTIVLANEVFGTGSEATLVAAPQSLFTIDVAKDDIAVGEVATVKLTLNKSAVFGENLSLIDNWASSNATLVFNFDNGTNVAVGGAGAPYTQNANFEIVVDQGGEIDDNTVTFKITNTGAAAAVLTSVTVGQYRTKNLTSALARGVANPTVNLGAEFRNVNTTVTDTSKSLVIFKSIDGVGLASTEVTGYTAAPGKRARIDVADTEFSFTGNLLANTGTGAAQDFNETDNVAFVDLGNLHVIRQDSEEGFELNEPNYGLALVKKENGDDFDFNGDDSVKLTIASTQSLNAYSSIYLRSTVNGACTATTSNGDFVKVPAAGATSVEIMLSGETTQALEDGYRVCAIAKGDASIPESSFSAQLNVTYFNPRYTNSEDTLEYGAILRNGCQITLFNLPNVTAADDAFLRITNVSEKPGAVRVSVWPETGGATTIDTNTVVVENLAAHATAVLHTAADQTTGVYLGSKLPAYGAVTTGRHRIVIQGAFPACEGMGLVRTPAGVLTNMTSTTYSGDESRLGQQNNGTSNTTN